MNIEDRIAAAGTGEVGTRFVDAHGRTFAEFPAGTDVRQDEDAIVVSFAHAAAQVQVLRGRFADHSDLYFNRVGRAARS